ncbi:MAG: 4Fe-4S binding protein [Oscillospiraceae bacterium]
MVRKIIKIDEDKCSGCGLCASACHEGAIEMVDGKAKLMRDDYCDGLGNCLPACPAGAISFEDREAKAFDENAVKDRRVKAFCPPSGGCPGSAAKAISRGSTQSPASEYTDEAHSELTQWPVQIKLAPVNAPYFDGANLLVAADCTAFVFGDFHRKFIKNHITLIGCPKLDDIDYTEKLTAILKNNNIKSVKAVRMQVPCCTGIERAVKEALIGSGKMIPWQVVVLSTDGQILED